jgi:hypothetical protein
MLTTTTKKTEKGSYGGHWTAMLSILMYSCDVDGP